MEPFKLRAHHPVQAEQDDPEAADKEVQLDEAGGHAAMRRELSTNSLAIWFECFVACGIQSL